MKIALSFVVGVFLWTLLEYVLHRWVFHHRVLGKQMAADHTRHHAEVSWFAPLSKKLALAAVIVGPLFVFGFWAPVLSWTGIGILSGWVAYEILHWRLHVAPPIGAYGRWARRHHLAHHFGNPMKNHGVSSPLWDIVFSTRIRPEVVHVPKKHVAKFPWLLDPNYDTPTLNSAWAADYQVTGGR